MSVKYSKQSSVVTNVSKNSTKSQNDCKSDTDHNLYKIFILISTLKILLTCTYHSTDFEVHRNWLAITHTLPISQWYVNAKSQWTLDYPPFFAWYEYFLSQFAKAVDSEMLKVNNLNYTSFGTILFQRFTVILSDFVLLIGVRDVGRVFSKDSHRFFILCLLILCSVGLIIVDHIHFQYNGFLLGILLISIAQVSKVRQANILLGAAAFAVLLNLKHLYLYVAPSFIVWLLKGYCLKSENFFKRLIYLGAIVLAITLLSFGPFLSQLPQVFERLFPFKRGLVHAYWAGNVWALYIGADKIFSAICKYHNLCRVEKSAVMTGGLVQEYSLSVLPTPTPFVTFIATILSIIPIMVCLLRKSQKELRASDFVRCLILCALSSFIFGWHVHEKAILTAIIPLSILAINQASDARIFIILSTAGHVGVLPLLFLKNLTLLKIIMTLTYQTAAIVCLQRLFHCQRVLKFYEWIYVCFSLFITLYETIGHKILFADSLPFLPLALTSIYCAVGVIYSWIFYYYMYCSNSLDENVAVEKDRMIKNSNYSKVREKIIK